MKFVGDLDNHWFVVVDRTGRTWRVRSNYPWVCNDTCKRWVLR
jgi:hypothetical protein